MGGTNKPEIKVPVPMPAETIPVAKPRFCEANQAEPKAMAGTKEAPLPRPVNRRMAIAKPKDCARPVKIMVVPMSIMAKVMTMRVPNRAARNPPMIAIVK